MMWSRAMKRSAMPTGGGGGGTDWSGIIRGAVSGMGAAAQANQGWGGPGRAYGAGIGTAMDYWIDKDKREEKQEDWMERLEADHELRLKREREAFERDMSEMDLLKEIMGGNTKKSPASEPPSTPENLATKKAFDILGINRGLQQQTQQGGGSRTTAGGYSVDPMF